jgi:hypothetical protein
VVFVGLDYEGRSHGWTRIYTDGLEVKVIGFEGQMNTDAAPPLASSRPSSQWNVLSRLVLALVLVILIDNSTACVC